MVTLSSLSSIGSPLYLEIRCIQLWGEQTSTRYCINGMVGDGCDEAFIRAELGEFSQVEIIPICNEDGSGGMLDQSIDRSELSRLILETLNHLYFCVDTPPRRRRPGHVTGYADSGRLYRLRTKRSKPHSRSIVAEPQPCWQAA